MPIIIQSVQQLVQDQDCAAYYVESQPGMKYNIRSAGLPTICAWQYNIRPAGLSTICPWKV